MIIDAWVQHPSPKFVSHEMFSTLRRWIGLDTIPDEIPLELTLGAMDLAKVDKALLSAWWGPEGALISNEEVYAATQRYPDRLVGVGSVNLYDPMQAVRQVRQCAEEYGFKAIRVLPWLWGLPPDDRRYYPVYAALIDHGLPFCLQVGHAGPRRPSEPGRPIPYLDTVVCEFPELVVVGGHVGYPWTEEMVAMARKYPNVYIDTSAYKPSRFPPELVRYLQTGGAKKVLFGSNFPMIQPADCLSGLDALGLSEDDLNQYLSGNAKKVFGL